MAQHYDIVFFDLERSCTGFVSDILGKSQVPSQDDESEDLGKILIHTHYDSGDLIELKSPHTRAAKPALALCGKTEDEAIAHAKVYLKRLRRIETGDDRDAQKVDDFFGVTWELVTQNSQIPGLYDDVLPLSAGSHTNPDEVSPSCHDHSDGD